MHASTRTSAMSTPPPLRYNEVWTIFLNKFYFKRRVHTNGALEKQSNALARRLRPLKQMAEVEDWGENDIILVNYFVHTFQELHRLQTKTRTAASANQTGDDPIYLAEHDDHIHFHTGLITSNMEPI